MLILALHGAALRALAVGAAAQLGQSARVLELAPDDPALPVALRGAAAGDAPLLVHDFAPDVDASMRWLDALGDGAPPPRVLALLGAPADAAVHRLVSRPHRFACVGVALGHELTRRQLAERLEEARATARHGALAGALTAGWPLDALLQALARDAFALGDGARRWPSLTALLRASGVARRTFVRHAARAGFRPPLRFLQVVRVAGAAAAIRGGETTAAAAVRFGYGSTDTLRRHFAALTGLTPRDARHLDATELIARMRGADGA